MMKTIGMIFLCNIISINVIAGNTHSCYICENRCERPGANDVKSCTDNDVTGISGKTFVAGAMGYSNATNAYSDIGATFADHAISKLGINATILPKFTDLTQWVCYVSNDKTRGCLLMGKGLCEKDKSWLGKITSIGDKLAAMANKGKEAVTAMFGTGSTSLSEPNKQGIGDWFAQYYMGQLINNTKGAQFQLESCCAGDKCNSASIMQKSIAVFVLLFLSIFILV